MTGTAEISTSVAAPYLPRVVVADSRTARRSGAEGKGVGRGGRGGAGTGVQTCALPILAGADAVHDGDGGDLDIRRRAVFAAHRRGEQPHSTEERRGGEGGRARGARWSRDWSSDVCSSDFSRGRRRS